MRDKHSRWEYVEDRFEFRRWLNAKRPAKMVDYFCDGKALNLKVDMSKPRFERRVLDQQPEVNRAKCETQSVRTEVIPARIRRRYVELPLWQINHEPGGWRKSVARWIKRLRWEIRWADRRETTGGIDKRSGGGIVGAVSAGHDHFGRGIVKP